MAVEDLLEADLALWRHGGPVAELEARLAETPLRERLWGLLMLALVHLSSSPLLRGTMVAGANEQERSADVWSR